MRRRALLGTMAAAFLVGSTGPGLAATVDLTSGTSGTTQLNQSFDNETRGIDVTVLGSSDLVVTSMTLSTLDAFASPTSVGARIYTSAGVLLASATTTVSAGAQPPITLLISATLSAGQSYRVSFFNSSGVGDMFDPDSTPYTESSGTFQVNGAFRHGGDVFPTNVNIFFPRVEITASVAGSAGCGVDQFNLVSNGFLGVSPSQTTGQTFCVDTTGQLTGVEIAPRLSLANPSDTVFIEVFDDLSQSLGSTSMLATSFPLGDATIPDPLVLGSEGPGYFDLTALDIFVSASDCLSFIVTKPAGNNIIMGTSDDNYPDGTVLVNGSPASGDAAFKACIVAGAEPEPVPALPLRGLAVLSMALLAAAVIARRRLPG